MTLASLGIELKHIVAAIDDLRAGRVDASAEPSKNTYLVVADQDLELWDLKAVTHRAAKLAGEPQSFNKRYNTRKFQPDLLQMGFSFVRYDEERFRKLGVRGFSTVDLQEPHILFVPPDGAEIRNGLLGHNVAASPDNPASRRESVTFEFIRNTAFVRAVLESAGGVCQSCGSKAFQTLSGEWFLEVHHKTWLSENGADAFENMIALCPNCHRQEHHGAKRKYF